MMNIAKGKEGGKGERERERERKLGSRAFVDRLGC